MSEPSQPGFFASRTVPSVRASPRQPPRRRRAPRARRGSAPPSRGRSLRPSEAKIPRLAPEYLPNISIGGGEPANARVRRSCQPGPRRRHAPFSDVHHPLALCREKGGHPRATLPVGPRAPYLQTPPCPLPLQTFEQQSAFVVQDEPDGKHAASVVVVVLVVTVVVVVGA